LGIVSYSEVQKVLTLHLPLYAFMVYTGTTLFVLLIIYVVCCFFQADTHADLVEFSGSSTDGHRVMGIACLSGQYLTKLQHLTWNIPHSWNLKQAATVPLAYSMVSSHHCSFSDLGYSKYKDINECVQKLSSGYNKLNVL
jgi:hypothetical protein